MTVVALAAGMMFGGASLAVAQDAADRAQEQGQKAQEQTRDQLRQGRDRVQQAGQDAARDASQGASDQADRAVQAGSQQAGQQAGHQQGQQVDMQVRQLLQQIQQSPEMAGDKLFVLGAALDNQFETHFSQQAAEKAQNPEVKKLAQMMVQDHQMVGQKLQQVAQQLQMQAPQGLTSMKQQEIQILSSLPSDQFDKAYVAKMVEAHAKDVACFSNQSSMAQNQQVKQFASQTLPKLQEHQQHVMRAAQAIGLNAQGGDAVQAGAREKAGASDTGSQDQSK
jgi:putative membrane protein